MGLKKIKWPEAFNLGAFQRSNFKNIPFSTYLHIYLLEGVMGSDAVVCWNLNRFRPSIFCRMVCWIAVRSTSPAARRWDYLQYELYEQQPRFQNPVNEPEWRNNLPIWRLLKQCRYNICFNVHIDHRRDTFTMPKLYTYLWYVQLAGWWSRGRCWPSWAPAGRASRPCSTLSSSETSATSRLDLTKGRT